MMDKVVFFAAAIAVAVVGVAFGFVLLRRRGNDGDVLVSERLDSFGRNLRDEFARNRKETAESNSAARKENSANLMAFQNSVNAKLDALTKNTQESLTVNLTKFMQTLSVQIEGLSRRTQESLNAQQDKVQSGLRMIQESNEKKLEQMRVTVDEKLQSTLERRLTGSFEIVTRQLEAVQKGLGEMRTLAGDVGGLKRALMNVKTAGGIGEVQLESLLLQILSPEQFVRNAHPNPRNPGRVVEFAVKIPSKTSVGEYVLLPVDSKYPAAVWDRLAAAYENADRNEIEAQKKVLVADIRKMARDIKEKYIEVPYTTDFGLMFLPFEGLFAEVMRLPGLFSQLQDEFKVTVAGPTTLGAFLNSLQMGFRTLAIQRETSRIWELLGSVRAEFGRFGTVLEATKKKLEAAHSEIERAETRTRVIEKKLTEVESIPASCDGITADVL